MSKILRSKAKAAIFLAAVFLFSLSGTGTVFAATGTSAAAGTNHYRYVSLGDSLAAGQTPFGIEKAYGYTNAIQNDLAKAGVAGGYRNFGKSGLTAQELLQQLTPGNPDYNPDMTKALKSADIVTLDIGANDLLPFVALAFSNPAMWGQFPSVEEQDFRNIGGILAVIRELNPSAKVYVMGYYDALVNIMSGSAQNHNLFLALLGSFNAQLETVVKMAGCEYVSTFGVVTKEELPGDIHPNREGYAAIAGQFWARIQQDFQLS